MIIQPRPRPIATARRLAAELFGTFWLVVGGCGAAVIAAGADVPGSIGLVVERKRLPHEQDGLMWFCEKCNHKLYEEYFGLGNVETDFPPVFERFYRSRELRTCTACGHLNPAPAKYDAEG